MLSPSLRPLPPLARVALALLLSPLLAACGGGGGGGGGHETLRLTALSGFDGHVKLTGEVSSGLNHLAVGDDLADVPVRAFMAFDLAGVPPGVQVLGATLEIRQINVIGIPYTALGRIELTGIDLGAALDAGDYSSGPIVALTTPAILSETSALEVKSADVKTQVSDALSQGRPRVDFRAAFGVSTNLDTSVDAAHFGSHETPSPATLTIVYR